MQEIGEPQDHRLFQLVGLFLSESAGDAMQLDHVVSSEQIEDFAQYVQNAWGDRLYADDYTNAAMLDGGAGDESASDTLTQTLTNRRLTSRLRAFVRTEAGQRRLGDDVFTAGLAAQKHLLRALFAADAEICNNSLELHATSRGLLQDTQLLLLGFGIQSSMFAIASERSESPTLAASASSPVGWALPTMKSSARATKDGGHCPPYVEGSDRRNGDDSIVTRAGGAGVSSGRLADRFGRIRASSSRNVVSRDSADTPRHGLRIDAASLRSFGSLIGLLPGQKARQLADAISLSIAAPAAESGHFDRVACLVPLGRQQVFDLTEPVTHSFIANGLTVHNCSEYMFLDDTACNLASLNVLTFFDSESGRFDLERFKHGVRIWTIVLEISVLMASFPIRRHRHA